ncbi:hypothetical protein M378DRAFT_79441 [Amanita muscaria Koide BX008]|uniref:Lon protease homolog n=1 Tax=Amanita muscaria (strain Koide BX008) TaxID=946122 RepID=A0A0C2SK59_AMAMK|nr:hypothetical protein M378DRAFT_79441 [Amanita muscaria Koide BX008]
MTSSKLPILALPYPVILLPTIRFTLSVHSDVGEAILSLIEESDTLPVVAAVPITTPGTDDSPQDSALAEWGTAARVLRLVKPTSRNLNQPYLVSLHGLTRVKVLDATSELSSESSPPWTNSLPLHQVEYPPTEKDPSRESVDKFKYAATRLLDGLAKDAFPPAKRDNYLKMAAMLQDMTDHMASWMADVLMGSLNGEHADKLAMLSTAESEARLRLATEIFVKQASIFEVRKKVATAVDESLSKQQKEFFLRQQLAAIQRELSALRRSSTASREKPGDSSSDLNDDDQSEVDDMAELKRKIEAMSHGSEERKMGVREWKRLKHIPQGSVEHSVIRSYLEWLTSMPWPNTNTFSSLPIEAQNKQGSFLANAREQLDADHFGLDKVKRRLIEYLAVIRLKHMNAEREREEEQDKMVAKAIDQATAPENKGEVESVVLQRQQQQQARKGVKGPILLFVGPPGTGKTSLGQSIAKVLGRPFQRISLGGVRDEAEIRGHRRTYVASGPGLIVQALRKAGRQDPVVLLDEIDKVGHSNFHGDPAAALLEVLDPEQNHTFNDHYINVPIDLSHVLFICTANTLETISAPLLDRCEVIQLSGYTYDEKMHIARRFLISKQLKANGLDEDQFAITEPALLHIATRYTREAGVRSLERAIGAVVRCKAVEWAEDFDSTNDGKKQYKKVVEEHELEKMIGIARWDGDETEREQRRGLVYGLVVMGQGEGGILPVETIAMPGSGKLKLTGSLGEVIKESGELALSWVKSHAYELCVTDSRSQDPLNVGEPVDIHIHLPAGAQKKDGPSAGVAMVCALVSLLTGACVPTSIAMTGEVTLRGRVTPVGGIKEKVLGAHRAHMTTVILPWGNRKEVEHEVGLEIRNEMQFVFVRTVEDALEAAFGKNNLMWRRGCTVMLESRL